MEGVSGTQLDALAIALGFDAPTLERHRKFAGGVYGHATIEVLFGSDLFGDSNVVGVVPTPLTARLASLEDQTEVVRAWMDELNGSKANRYHHADVDHSVLKNRLLWESMLCNLVSLARHARDTHRQLYVWGGLD